MKLRVAAALGGELPADVPVQVCGWVRSRRTSKAGVTFIELNDGSCFASLQLVASASLPGYAALSHIGPGTALCASGRIVESIGSGQAREMQVEAAAIVGGVDDPETYPISRKRHTFEYLRTVAHLRPRTNTFGAISRVRHAIAHAAHDFLDRRGYLWVNTPIITASDCEGAGALFRVSTLDLANVPRTEGGTPDFTADFFGEPTYLTVSGQLQLETHSQALGNVYAFGPTFRAENSNTSRHLAEFWMIEPETAFADLDANARLAEDFLKAIVTHVLERRGDDIAFFRDRIDATVADRLERVASARFARMTYGEAIDVLARAPRAFEFPVAWGRDLQSEHERYLTEVHVQGPLVVTDYPKDIKAFYMRQNDDGRTVAAMDVLVPGVGEIIGGSQREERLDVLDARMAGLHAAPGLSWYRDLRRYGTTPHAGFGAGLERLVLYVTGMDNIRDAIPFPRTPQSAKF
jgi:asparaginyl-tRNA synthetase